MIGIYFAIFFGILAALFALGMIADKDAENRKNFKIAFVTLIIAISIILIKFV